MTTQDILFIVGLSLVVLGVLLLGIAAYIFFKRNILDIVADLNGTKRAEALAEMAKETGRSRRRSRSGESTGNIAVPTDGMSSEELNSARRASVDYASESQESIDRTRASAMRDVDSSTRANTDTDATTVMEDDSTATAVLAPDSADATTLLVENKEEETELLEVSQPKSETMTQSMSSVQRVDTSAIEPTKHEAVVEEPIPDFFHIVRKIVLTQSAEFIKPEQGENYA